LRSALDACEKRVHGILETAVNAIITINARGVIETVNEATVRHLWLHSGGNDRAERQPADAFALS